MRTFLMVLVQLFATAAIAEQVQFTKDSNGKITEITIEGDYGYSTHSLFNFVEYYFSTPTQSGGKFEYQGENFTAKKWTKFPDDMHGDAYVFQAGIDGKTNLVKEENGKIILEGKIAEILLTGMWNMHRDYEHNFTVVRGRRFGDIVIQDLFSNSVKCEIAHREVQGLLERFVTCEIGL